MRTFLHLVNPVAVGPESDLLAAQPVTFAAMEDARLRAASHGVTAHLCAVGYAEDASAMPPAFHRRPDLTRSVLDAGRFETPRRLPLLADLIACALDAADHFGADTLIYTNVDIAPMPDFYLAIAALLDAGHDAFTINRRTIARDWPNGVSDLPLMRAQLGTPHPGRDCFVFGRGMARGLDPGAACIGVQFVGKVLAANLLCRAKNYADFADLHLTFHLGDDRRWLSPAQREYTDHNRRELAAVLGRLRASGGASSHPAWTDLVTRFADAG